MQNYKVIKSDEKSPYHYVEGVVYTPMAVDSHGDANFARSIVYDRDGFWEEPRTCTLCGQTKPKSDYFVFKYKGKQRLRARCKECMRSLPRDLKKHVEEQREYVKKNREEINKRGRERYAQNREEMVAIRRRYVEDNYDTVREKARNAGKQPAGLDTPGDKLLFLGEVRRGITGVLEAKCSYCGGWFLPTRNQVSNRIGAVYGKYSGEQRFYCGDYCKNHCSVFGRRGNVKTWDRDIKTRLDQRQLRDMVIERDGYACVICGERNKELFCHHIDPVICNPIESADMDNCITLCRACHVKAHSDTSCSLSTLRKAS